MLERMRDHQAGHADEQLGQRVEPQRKAGRPGFEPARQAADGPAA